MKEHNFWVIIIFTHKENCKQMEVKLPALYSRCKRVRSKFEWRPGVVDDGGGGGVGNSERCLTWGGVRESFRNLN